MKTVYRERAVGILSIGCWVLFFYQGNEVYIKTTDRVILCVNWGSVLLCTVQNTKCDNHYF